MNEDIQSMYEYVEVEFRSGRLGYYLCAEHLAISPETILIVEVERGYDIAKVVHCSMRSGQLDEMKDSIEKHKIIRVATEEDFKKLEEIVKKEEHAEDKFLEMMDKYPFQMKLIEVVYQFDENKLTFFFTAETRIDFRDFVRELATYFKTRIELHQSTGRDVAKRISGIGMCGYKYCCSSHLKRFNQVTVQMVKDQNLSGSLSKISGPCGRLLCCLQYEEDYYAESSKVFPVVGEEVSYKNTTMYVYKNDYYNNNVHLSTSEGIIEMVSLQEYDKIKVCQKCNRAHEKNFNNNRKRNPKT